MSGNGIEDRKHSVIGCVSQEYVRKHFHMTGGPIFAISAIFLEMAFPSC